MIKKFLPKTLFFRYFLIIIAPVIFLQLIITIVFFDSLWLKTNKGLVNSLSNEISTFINLYQKEESEKKKKFCLNFFKKINHTILVYLKVKLIVLKITQNLHFMIDY